MSGTDFLSNARLGWGETPPDWIVALAEACMRSSATEVGKRLDYSVAVITSVVRNNYRGSLAKVEAKVRGAYLGELVDCPALGEIERDRCEQEQGRKFFGTSANRARLYRACRGGCPNSRLKGGADV
jgi:hypothetical protein